MRERPAWRAGYEAHRVLLVETVELVHHAIDVVGQRIAFVADALEIGEQPLEADRFVRLGRHGETEIAQGRQHARMPGRRGPAFHRAEGVGEKGQGTGSGDPRIELPQRSGRAVARIGQGLFAAFARPRVVAFELLARHVDLAAHFEHGGQRIAAKPQRDRPDGAEIRRDVFAGGAVAPGSAAYEQPVLVTQADGEAVEFGLDRKRRRLVAGRLHDAFDEVAHVLVGEGVVERKHRHFVPDLGETARRLGADALGRRIGTDQRRVLRFDAADLGDQPVVVGIGNRGFVEHVITMVVLGDLAQQGRVPSGRFARNPVMLAC